jgi:hypothetical protein
MNDRLYRHFEADWWLTSVFGDITLIEEEHKAEIGVTLNTLVDLLCEPCLTAVNGGYVDPLITT